MPSQRKRIGFLPTEEVHKIIDKLCRANEFSQSKVTGLLVEEALRARGALSESILPKTSKKQNFINFKFEKEAFYKIYQSQGNRDDFIVNKKELSEDIKMIHEFIEYKYFKKVMSQNKNIFE